MKLVPTPVVGSIVNVRVAFTDPDNDDVAVDPNDLEIRMKTPADVTTTYVFATDAEVVQESVGNYLFRLTLAEEGTYRWTWHASTPTKAVVIAGFQDAAGGI